MPKNKAFLIILDGWGIAKDPERSAISQAKTPFIDSLIEDYPNSTLVTYGSEVGLPDGQMGNSEVGHLNLGAGRIVYQDFARINKEIKEGAFAKNEKLVQFFSQAEAKKAKVHFMGLLSDGGVHSHISHLKALCDAASTYNLFKVCIHAFMDGRDCDPNSGVEHIRNLLSHLNDKQGIGLSSLIGRYFAMDRDNRWPRIKKAYDLLVHGKSDYYTINPIETIQQQYSQEITDEFLPPISLDTDAKIEDGDFVLFFNFRTDRPRQITTALTQKDMHDHEMSRLNLNFVTMTTYDESYKGVTPLYTKENIKNTLGEVLAAANKTQVRIAETEKYPHVTFFFNGGKEEPFLNEKRILINSPQVDTYDLAPEMGAIEITDKILAEAKENKPDFICLNFANADMVGHTGIISAAITACETLDNQLKRIVDSCKDKYEIFVIADHGNSDIIKNEDGSPHTAHTTNPVPIILITDDNGIKLSDGKLGDIAPTILKRMGVSLPSEMNGNNLVS
jgi:2,3-bisphosphoglycerate-independent phosphoglycerate mutase